MTIHPCLYLSFFMLSMTGAVAQDLRLTNPDVMRKLEVLNQGKYGTCYAFTGAFLIDYNRFTNNSALKSRTSPYSIANSFAKANGISVATSGGYVCAGVKASVVASKLKAFENFSDDASYDQVGLAFHRLMVTKIVTSYAPHKPGVVFPTLSKAQYKTKSLRNPSQENLFQNFNKLYEEFKSVMSYSFYVPGAYQPSAKDAFFALQSTILKNNWGSLSQNFIGMMLTRSISEFVKIPKVSCVDTESPALFSTQIKSELQKNRPVGISFCSRVISESTFRSSNSDSANCRPHAVVLIGQKSIGGEDHFLIRNSWGNNFNYDHNWIYDHGDLWISSKALLMNVYLVHSVK